MDQYAQRITRDYPVRRKAQEKRKYAHPPHGAAARARLRRKAQRLRQGGERHRGRSRAGEHPLCRALRYAAARAAAGDPLPDAAGDLSALSGAHARAGAGALLRGLPSA